MRATASPRVESEVTAPPASVPPSEQATPAPSPSLAVVTVTLSPAAGRLPPPSAQPLANVTPAIPGGGASPLAARPVLVLPTSAPPTAQVAAAPVGTAAPQILGATVSPDVVSTGTKVDATVRTTPEVVSVVAKIGGETIPVPKVGIGRFAGSTTVPLIPPFFHGIYPVTFVAVNARGVSTQAAVNVTVH